MKDTTNLKYSITNRATVIPPHERTPLSLNLLLNLLFLKRMKTVDIVVDQDKLTLEGHKTLYAGDFHLNVKREDFRGSTVDFRGIKIIGIIIGALFIAVSIFAFIVFFADLFGNSGDTLPLGIGIILLVLGLMIIIFSILKVTIITFRYVDRRSNSVRHLIIRVRKDAYDYYNTAKEFIEKIWAENA